MAKKSQRKTTTKGQYEFIKAIVSGNSLRWEYKLAGNRVVGRQSHDEDVSNWSEREILDLTYQILDVSEPEKDVVQVQYD